jgi:hypothetical protein
MSSTKSCTRLLIIVPVLALAALGSVAQTPTAQSPNPAIPDEMQKDATPDTGEPVIFFAHPGKLVWGVSTKPAV